MTLSGSIRWGITLGPSESMRSRPAATRPRWARMGGLVATALQRGLRQWDSCFFFSSRRRHTRLQGDWSSDVCSSDLNVNVVTRLIFRQSHPVAIENFSANGGNSDGAEGLRFLVLGIALKGKDLHPPKTEIGRAACRGRG